MTKEDLDFFQSIINEILRYITKAEIANENRTRQFKIVYINPDEEKKQPKRRKKQ